MPFHRKFFIFLNPLAVLLLSLCLLPRGLRPELYSCNKIFWNQFALFQFDSPELLDNKIKLDLPFEDRVLPGVLHFNMCGESILSNICGSDRHVIANYIFVVDQSPEERVKCILIFPKSEDQWNYSTFRADNQIVSLNGVRVEHDELVMEVLDGVSDYTHLRFNAEDISNLTAHGNLQNKLSFVEEAKKLYTKSLPVPKQAPVEASKPILKHNSLQPGSSEQKNVAQNAQVSGRDKDNWVDSAKLQRDVSRLQSSDSESEKDSVRTSLTLSASDSLLSNSKSPNKYQLLKYARNQSYKMFLKGTVVNSFRTEMNFYCEREDPKVKTVYVQDLDKLEINVYSKDGCLVEFELLQAIHRLPELTGAFFCVFGLLFLLLGLWLFKSLSKVFVPLIFFVLCITLYFMLVESITSLGSKIFALSGVLVVIFLLLVLLIWFNSVVYFVLGLTAACHLALIMKILLEQSISFFCKPSSEWILVVLTFAFVMLVNLISTDCFVIMCTSLVGSLFLILCCNFWGLIDYNFLFLYQVEKFLTPESKSIQVLRANIIFIFGIIGGFAVQLYLSRKMDAGIKDEDEFDEESKPDVEVTVTN